MDVKELRAEMGISLEEFAKLLGLQSKSHAHAIEDKNRCSVGMALKIEKLSEGRIPASSLNDDVGLVEAARHVDEAAADSSAA